MRAVLGPIFFTIVATALAPSLASATITQGDLMIYGRLSTQWAGRWGEGSVRDPGAVAQAFTAGRSGGTFDFNHWDLVEAKQNADLRADYRLASNYNVLGRFDTFGLARNIDLNAVYRGWYDAFGDLKPKGVAQAGEDLVAYSQRERVARFVRDELREYWAHIDVNDSLSFRIGKQQVIWTEADALSGTEVLNPADLSYHFIHFESPEDLRRGVRMLKMSYTLPDFLKTSTNQFEAFWVPGDYQGGLFANAKVDLLDPRDPYNLHAVDSDSGGVIINAISQSPTGGFQVAPIRIANQEGALLGGSTAHDATFNAGSPTVPLDPSLFSPLFPSINTTQFVDMRILFRTNNPGNSIKNSEFGARYSTLLPVGNGLQVSFIWEYLFRAQKIGLDPFGPPLPCQLAGTCLEVVGPDLPLGPANKGPGVRVTVNTTACNGFYATNNHGGMPLRALALLSPSPGCAAGPGPGRIGQAAIEALLNTQRVNFLGTTGTYYDRDFTEEVYRYDIAYRPRVGVFQQDTPKGIVTEFGRDYGAWTDEVIAILAADRPVYIPWISKQHTFLITQWTTNWYPSIHEHMTPTIFSTQAKLRKYQNFLFVAALNYLADSRLTMLNVLFWDIDDTVGFWEITNSWRYNKDVLLNLNAITYIGKSGRYTDPFLFSHNQRFNELEFRLTYEI